MTQKKNDYKVGWTAVFANYPCGNWVKGLWVPLVITIGLCIIAFFVDRLIPIVIDRLVNFTITILPVVLSIAIAGLSLFVSMATSKEEFYKRYEEGKPSYMQLVVATFCVISLILLCSIFIGLLILFLLPLLESRLWFLWLAFISLVLSTSWALCAILDIVINISNCTQLLQMYKDYPRDNHTSAS